MFVLLVGLAAASAFGATRYLSTTGKDVPDGGHSSAQAWRTFPFALAQLVPGDVLMVEPGTWTWNDGGVLLADCTGPVRNGRPDAGITVRSSIERQAHIVSNGATPAARLVRCEHWSLEGLYLEGADFRDAGFGNSTLYIDDCRDVVARRLLLSKDNRYDNNKLIDVLGSTGVLIEECELYDFFRVGIIAWKSSGVVVRRCYANHRGRGVLPGGYHRANRDRADTSFADESSGTIYENDISEGSRAGFGYYSYGSADDGRYLGVMSVNDNFGFMFQSSGNGAYGERNQIRDAVVFRPVEAGVRLTDARETLCEGSTVFQAADEGVLGAQLQAASSQLSVFANRTLVTGADASVGFSISNQATFRLSDVNAFGFSTPYSPATGTEIQRATSLDPGLGDCPVLIPDSSPMKRAAADGGDIGANILYRFENGQLTARPLWGPEFPCGAIVPGVNDVPDASCFDVHRRLRIDTCAFPSGYFTAPPTDGGEPADGGDTGLSDAGRFVRAPRQHSVGCGCGAASTGGLSALTALLVLLGHRHQRRRRWENHFYVATRPGPDGGTRE
jgi:hypothetical protein